MTCLESIELSSKTVERHTFVQNHRNGKVSTFLVSSTKTIGSSANSPDLNPLDYSIWNELAHEVNWDTVTSKTTLISELKPAVRKVSPDVVFEKLFVLD